MVPPFASNHAATLEILPDGLALAWFSGTAEEANNCSIVYSFLPSGSNQWVEPIVVALQSGYSNQNPVLFYDHKDGLIHLYYSQIKAEAGEDKAEIWYTLGTFDGRSWGPLFPWYTVPGSFTRNRIVPTRNGLLFPVYNSTISYSFMLISDPQEKSWTRVNIPNSDSLVQPSVVRLTPRNNDTLLCFFRDRQSRHIYSSTSTDEGRTWTSPKPTALPNNNAGIEAFQLASGATAIVFDKTKVSPRTPLVVALSDDGGRTWPHLRTLQAQNDPIMPLKSGAALEFSYPTILQDEQGNIHIAYTYDRLTIKYVRVTEAWIRQGD